MGETLLLSDKTAHLIETMTPTIFHKGIGSYLIENNSPYRFFSLPFIPPEAKEISYRDGSLWYGWESVPREDLTFWETWEKYNRSNFDWSYELVRTKNTCTLLAQGREIIYKLKPTVQAAKAYLASHTEVHGIVWWEDVWNYRCKKVKYTQTREEST